jgi:hypothetical protein
VIFLNSVNPGWWEKIDLERLDMLDTSYVYAANCAGDTATPTAFCVCPPLTSLCTDSCLPLVTTGNPCSCLRIYSPISGENRFRG